MTSTSENEVALPVANHFALQKKADIIIDAIARVSKIKAWEIKNLIERVLPVQQIISTRVRGPVSERSACVVVDVEMSTTQAVENALSKLAGQSVTFAGVPGSFSLRPSLPPLDISQDASLLKATCNKSQQVLVLHNLPVKWFSAEDTNKQTQETETTKTIETTETKETTITESTTTITEETNQLETVIPSFDIVKNFFESNFGAVKDLEIDHEQFNSTRNMTFDVALRFQQITSLHQALTYLCGRILINKSFSIPSSPSLPSSNSTSTSTSLSSSSSNNYSRARYRLAVVDEEYFDARNVRKRKFDRDVRTAEHKTKLEEERKKVEKLAKDEQWARQRIEADALRKRINVLAKKIVHEQKKPEPGNVENNSSNTQNTKTEQPNNSTKNISQDKNAKDNEEEDRKEREMMNQRFSSDNEDDEEDKHFRRKKVERKEENYDKNKKSDSHHHHRDSHHHHHDSHKRSSDRSDKDRREKKDRRDDRDRRDDKERKDDKDRKEERDKRDDRDKREKRDRRDKKEREDREEKHSSDHSSKRRKSDDNKSEHKRYKEPDTTDRETKHVHTDKNTESEKRVEEEKVKKEKETKKEKDEKEEKGNNPVLKQLQDDKSNTLKLLMLAKSAQQKKHEQAPPVPASPSSSAQQTDTMKMELALREKLLRNIVKEKINAPT